MKQEVSRHAATKTLLLSYYIFHVPNNTTCIIILTLLSEANKIPSSGDICLGHCSLFRQFPQGDADFSAARFRRHRLVPTHSFRPLSSTFSMARCHQSPLFIYFFFKNKIKIPPGRPKGPPRNRAKAVPG